MDCREQQKRESVYDSLLRNAVLEEWTGNSTKNTAPVGSLSST
ncbi:MAG: hypothetical protein ACI9PP_002280, partial [Halobacteriales archaeon]